MNYQQDRRVVLTLDAGGTNFAFTAIRGGEPLGDPVTLPAEPNNLNASLDNLISGFQQLISKTGCTPAAISFAFPGPADYPNGVIYNVGNLPAYQGGVAVGPMLEDHFGVPAYINNDGDLFAYGEAIAGALPRVNRLLAEAGSPKRYRNLFAVTLGTGFGGGIVRDGEMFLGDNSAAGEVWILRNRVRPTTFAEEGASIRAVQAAYAHAAGDPQLASLTPRHIYNIGRGEKTGNQAAALEAFDTLGKVVGDALANAITLIDGMVVIGGGLAGAAELFMPRLIQEMNGTIQKYNGDEIPRLAQQVFDLTNSGQLEAFLRGDSRLLMVPRSQRQVNSDPMMRIGVAISELGANRAVAIGAYAHALQQLDRAADS